MSQASESCISSSEEWFKKNQSKKKTKSARKSKWVTDPYLREKLRAAVWEYQYLADFDKKYKQPSKQNIEARYKIQDEPSHAPSEKSLLTNQQVLLYHQEK